MPPGPATSAVPIPQPAPPARRGPDTGSQTAPPVGGPPTTVDPLAGSRPSTGRTPGTTSLPSWAATPGPPAAAPSSTPPTVDATPDGPAGEQDPSPTRSTRVARDAAVEAASRAGTTGRSPDDGGPDGPPPVDTGPVGRAADRAERQAADAIRRKEDRRRDAEAPPAATPPTPERPRSSRAVVGVLVAVVVVALVALSVWAFSRPGTDTASADPASVTASATSSAAATTAGAPATTAAPAATGPVFAPVSVLNSAGINGLAAEVGDALAAGGWEIRSLGAYGGQDVATTTVYYTEGDSTQQQAAESLTVQFPDISGPAVRFFEIPDVPDPGIVVVATGSWRP